MKKIILAVSFLAATFAWANPKHHTPPQMPKEFEFLKKLVGTWEGKMTEEGKTEEVVVNYQLTSGGTALEERLFQGKPDEMVSIYHKEGKSLGMVHFCAMGNQPHMRLKKATDKFITFEMQKPIGISSMKETHMHAITLSMTDDGKLKQEWTNYVGGKKGGTVEFIFTRK